jgi:hypothetical protein
MEILRELAGSYLLKDILELDRIKASGTGTTGRNSCYHPGNRIRACE